MLIEQCLSRLRSVIYVVSNEWEQQILSQEMTALTTSHNVRIITHAVLYGWAKSFTILRHLRPSIAIICEADAHYSLEFALGLACTMYAARNMDPGAAHVLTVSHQDVESDLCGLLRSLAPSMGSFQQLNLGPPPQNLETKYWDGFTMETSVVDEIGKALQQGQDVLVFCEYEDEECRKMFFNLRGKVPLYNVHLSDAGIPISACTMAFKKQVGELMLGKQKAVPREDWPTLYTINNAGRIHFPIQNLGLVVVFRFRRASSSIRDQVILFIL